AIRESHDPKRILTAERDRLLSEHLRAESASLCRGAAREVLAGDARRKSEVVLDLRARPRLSAGSALLDDERVQPLGSAVDRGRQPGGAAADDDDVVERLLRARLKPDLRGELLIGRRDEARAVGKEDHGQTIRVARGPDQLVGRRVLIYVDPL